MTWHKRSKRSMVRLRATRALTKTVREFEKLGWDAQDLATYCEAMPAFGRAQGLVVMRHINEMQFDGWLAELEGAGAA